MHRQVLLHATAQALFQTASVMVDAKKAERTIEVRMTDAMRFTPDRIEVRKVDKESKKITLKHGEIKNLGMRSMTMVFQVKDPAMLDKVKAGDKVLFAAEKPTAPMSSPSWKPRSERHGRSDESLKGPGGLKV